MKILQNYNKNKNANQRTVQETGRQNAGFDEGEY